MTFTVRRATVADLDELVRLWQERMDNHTKADSRIKLAENAPEEWRGAVESWFSREDVRVLVAVREDGLIGYMIAWLRENPPMLQPPCYGLITEMVVDGHCKQGGVGTALLVTMKAWLKTQDVTYLEIRVSHRQAIEQAFWRASGAGNYFDHLWYKLD